MTRFTIVGLASAILADGCSDGLGPQTPEWATAVFGNDVIIWTSTDAGDGGSIGNPLVSSNFVYFAADQGVDARLVALDVAAGAKQWEAPIDFVREIVDAGNEIAAVSFGASFFGLSGSFLRSVGNSHHATNAIIEDTRVVIGTGTTGAVEALDRQSGGLIWSARINDGNVGTRLRSLAATSDRIFAVAIYHTVGAPASLVVASIDRVTGDLLWEKVLGTSDSFARPVFWGDNLYVALVNNEVIALSQATGAEAWRWKAPETGASNLGALATCGGRVVTSRPRGVTALDASAGTTSWSNTSIDAGAWRSLQCVDGRVVLGPHPTVVLDDATGTTLAAYPRAPIRTAESFAITGVTFHQGNLYVTTSMGSAKLKAP